MFVQILGESYGIDRTVLNFYNKNISKLPESIDKLVNLKCLYLGVNLLTTLPESIDKLVNLTELSLHNNLLTVLPESISNLVNLTYLSLNNNQLQVIPESIGRLLNLTYLSLSYNQLQILPASILNIKKSLQIYTCSYEINNLQVDTEFLIFSYLDKELTNLPTGLKEIWIQMEKKGLNHKLPFGCVIKYF
jgi:Leucine-rich repeat (LRR) protein